MCEVFKSPAVADTLEDFYFPETPFLLSERHVRFCACVSTIPACFHSAEGGLL